MEEYWQNAELTVEGLPAVGEVTYHHHPLRYLNYTQTVTSVFWAFLVIPYVILTLLFPENWSYYVGGGLVILMVTSYIGNFIGFKRRSYALREKDITYRKGWLFYSTTTIPFNRIQHSEVSQGPVEQNYHLSTLKIYTAGGSSSDLSIPGLEDDEAQRLRDFISKKVSEHA